MTKKMSKAEAKQMVASWTPAQRQEAAEIFAMVQEQTGLVGMKAVATLPTWHRERITAFVLGWR